MMTMMMVKLVMETDLQQRLQLQRPQAVLPGGSSSAVVALAD
jgi:hypothetical protein